MLKLPFSNCYRLLSLVLIAVKPVVTPNAANGRMFVNRQTDHDTLFTRFVLGHRTVSAAREVCICMMSWCWLFGMAFRACNNSEAAPEVVYL